MTKHYYYPKRKVLQLPSSKQLDILQLLAFVWLLHVCQRSTFMGKDDSVHGWRCQKAAFSVYCQPCQTEASLRRSTSWYCKHYPCYFWQCGIYSICCWDSHQENIVTETEAPKLLYLVKSCRDWLHMFQKKLMFSLFPRVRTMLPKAKDKDHKFQDQDHNLQDQGQDQDLTYQDQDQMPRPRPISRPQTH